MKTSELDYELPEELIAQHPVEPRDRSRLLVYDRASGGVRHRRFSDLPGELPAGALVVVNDTRVVPARLRVERPGGGAAELLLLECRDGAVWEALARPSRRLRPGQRLGRVELLEALGTGRWLVRLSGEPAGETPLSTRASSGEARTLVLAWALAERSLLAEAAGALPVFAFDDFDSAWDPAVLARFAEALPDDGQVFLTSARAQVARALPLPPGAVWDVGAGVLSPAGRLPGRATFAPAAASWPQERSDDVLAS